MTAQRNVALGWCPCGDEYDGDCECGITRLSYAQGKLAPNREREQSAQDDAEDRERRRLVE